MKKLYRSDTNKVIAGVLGGIGEYFDIDPTLIRIGFLIIAILSHGFPAIVAYIIAVIIVPKHPSHTHAHHETVHTHTEHKKENQ